MREHLQYVEPSRTMMKGIATRQLTNYYKRYPALRLFLRVIGKTMGETYKTGTFVEKFYKMKEAMAAWSKVKEVFNSMEYAVPKAGTEEYTIWNHNGGVNFDLDYMVKILLSKDEEIAREAWDRKMQDESWRDALWVSEGWFKESPYYYLHQLHQAVEKGTDKGNVAFAETTEKALLSRYTSTKPGRYLMRFFGPGSAKPVLTEADIKKWVEKIAAQDKPLVLQFIEGDDSNGWVRVYRDGPASCMKENDAVQVYAHSGSVLRLAYCEVDGEILTRCIVREDTKKWLRCYPNPNGGDSNLWHTRMKETVEAAGYTRGDLMGVYLDAVDHDNGGASYVMPYVDSGMGGTPYGTLEGGRIKVGRNGDVDLQTQEGFVDFDDSNKTTCNECDERMDEDDAIYVENEEISICDFCYSRHFCSAIGRRGREVTARHCDCTEVNGTWYVDEYLSDNGVYECEYRDEYYHEDDLVYTLAGYVNVSDAVKLDEDDSNGNHYAYPGDERETHDGRKIHGDNAVVEEVNGERVTFHEDDDIEAYRAEYETNEEKEAA